MERKRWQDLTDTQKAAVIVGSTVQIGLATAAWIDLARRPRETVRGPKIAWAGIIAVNVIGPIAYFTLGRTHPIPARDNTSTRL